MNMKTDSFSRFDQFHCVSSVVFQTETQLFNEPNYFII